MRWLCVCVCRTRKFSVNFIWFLSLKNKLSSKLWTFNPFFILIFCSFDDICFHSTRILTHRCTQELCNQIIIYVEHKRHNFCLHCFCIARSFWIVSEKYTRRMKSVIHFLLLLERNAQRIFQWMSEPTTHSTHRAVDTQTFIII